MGSTPSVLLVFDISSLVGGVSNPDTLTSLVDAVSNRSENYHSVGWVDTQNPTRILTVALVVDPNGPVPTCTHECVSIRTERNA